MTNILYGQGKRKGKGESLSKLSDIISGKKTSANGI